MDRSSPTLPTSPGPIFLEFEPPHSSVDLQEEVKKPQSDEALLAELRRQCVGISDSRKEQPVIRSQTMLERNDHGAWHFDEFKGLKQRPVGKGPCGMRSENPQQKHFQFGDIVFDSRFDSGNMRNVEEVDTNVFDVFLNPDANPYIEQGGFRTWFYFCVYGVPPGEMLSFTIRNMNNQMKLYTSGLKPCFRVLPRQPGWRRIPGKVEPFYQDSSFHLTFYHTFYCAPNQPTFFAFSYPMSYTETFRRGEQLSSRFYKHHSVYFHRQVLAYSLQKRKQQLWTLSSYQGITDQREPLIPQLFPEHQLNENQRPFKFNKPCVFLTSRVHPGETPGSYVLKGILDFLTNENSEQAQLLLNRFVFKIIPILNVDGVSKGYYRLDTRLVNLNRMYVEPSLTDHPTIYAAKAAIIQQHKFGNLQFYLDLHAHAGKKGAFIFGNALENEQHIENLLFPRLIALNSLNFDFLESNFSDKMMTVKDKKDGLSREGAGRVGIYRETQLTHCYTLECNYQTGKRINYLPPKLDMKTGQVISEQPITDANNIKLYPDKRSPTFTIDIFEDIGKAVCLALLDYFQENPVSRVPRSNFKSVAALRAQIGINNNINVVENRKIKQKAQQSQKEEALKGQRSNSSKKGKVVRTPISSGRNSIVTLRRQNTLSVSCGNSCSSTPKGSAAGLRAQTEGNEVSNGSSDRQLYLESVKEEEKELMGTRELEQLNAGSETASFKKLARIPRPPHKKKPFSMGRYTDRMKASDKRRESENIMSQPCKIAQLEVNSAYQCNMKAGQTLVKLLTPGGGIGGMISSVPRYGSLPSTTLQIPTVSSVNLGALEKKPRGIFENAINPARQVSISNENCSLPPPASRRILHRSTNLLEQTKKKAIVKTPVLNQKRSNPFKQAGVSVVLKHPSSSGSLGPLKPPSLIFASPQERLTLLSMPAE